MFLGPTGKISAIWGLKGRFPVLREAFLCICTRKIETDYEALMNFL